MQPTPNTSLNSIDPLTRIEMLCVEQNLPPQTVQRLRELVREARAERDQWKDAYIDSALLVKQKEEQLAVLNQQNLAPIYGPLQHPLEDYITEPDKAEFAREKLCQFAEKNSPRQKGFYKQLATIINTWRQLGWLRAENYYGSEDQFIGMLQNFIGIDSILRKDSIKKAIRRRRLPSRPSPLHAFCVEMHCRYGVLSHKMQKKWGGGVIYLHMSKIMCNFATVY